MMECVRASLEQINKDDAHDYLRKAAKRLSKPEWKYYLQICLLYLEELTRQQSTKWNKLRIAVEVE